MTVSEALQILKEHGYKYTEKRETVLKILAYEARYLSAKEVLRYMQSVFPQLSFDTVYRNLNLLHELAVLEMTEINGERLYRMACAGDTHHHHLICTECGKARKLKICPMDVIFGQPEGFQITGHKFEVYGVCDGCAI